MFFFVFFIKWTQMNEEEKLKKKTKTKTKEGITIHYLLCIVNYNNNTR
jgi:hypothetical protein